MNKIEIDKLTARKKIKNNIIPLKIENLNPLKMNSANGGFEINQNKNLIVFIKPRNL